MPTLPRRLLLTLMLLVPAVGQVAAAEAPAPAPAPSTYDLTPHAPELLPPLGDIETADHALWSQVGRTLVALAAVVALIYVLARLVLPRFAARFGAGQGAIRIVERVALDTKHALVLVQVNELTFLVGTGDAGVQLVAELTGSAPQSFGQTLARQGDAGSRDDADPPPPEDRHARTN